MNKQQQQLYLSKIATSVRAAKHLLRLRSLYKQAEGVWKAPPGPGEPGFVPAPTSTPAPLPRKSSNPIQAGVKNIRQLGSGIRSVGTQVLKGMSSLGNPSNPIGNAMREANRQTEIDSYFRPKSNSGRNLLPGKNYEDLSVLDNPEYGSDMLLPNEFKSYMNRYRYPQ